MVSRCPLRDEAGQVIDALGVVLFDEPQANLQPLLGKFALLQRELDEARAALRLQQRNMAGQRRARHSFASFGGSSAAAVEVKRQARRAAQSRSPVLLLRGAQSDLVMSETVQAMRNRGPGALGRLRTIEVSGCGHAPALNVLQQFEWVQEFLASTL